jgi:hypothetical protein
VLKTWDFALDEVIDPAAVTAYVAAAVARYDDYKANSSKVLAASRSSARARKPPQRVPRVARLPQQN